MVMRPDGQMEQRQRKPFWRRYWLLRGRRREDKIARLVVLALLLALVPLAIVFSRSSSTSVYLPTVLKAQPPDPAADVLTLVNDARRQAGCAPLTIDDRLKQAASDWSRHMGNDDQFQHRDLAQLRTVYGYPFSTAGENIAAGYATARSVFDGWMASPGHRANILNCRYTQIGIGLAYVNPDDAPLQFGFYWTQNFGAPLNAPSTNAAERQEISTPEGIVAPYPAPEQNGSSQ